MLENGYKAKKAVEGLKDRAIILCIYSFMVGLSTSAAIHTPWDFKVYPLVVLVCSIALVAIILNEVMGS